MRGGRLIWSQASFEVPGGDIVAVIGANGSGKTTLLHMMLGLIPVPSGQLSVFGRRPGAGDRVGYVPQDYAASTGDAIRAFDAVMLGLIGRRWACGPATAAQRRQVGQTLDAVGAGGFANARAMAIATAISMTSVRIGLATSAMFNFPPSFLIVTIACGIWLTVWLADHRSRVPAEVLDLALVLKTAVELGIWAHLADAFVVIGDAPTVAMST